MAVAGSPHGCQIEASPGSDVWSLLQELQAESSAQKAAVSDLQRQIDLQRLATAELIGRSQSSSVTLDKFEEVAQSTAAAAEQLEAEVILVSGHCDSAREAITKEINAFRAELEDSCSKHYAHISELCASFSGKGGSSQLGGGRQATDGLARAELTAILEARDRNLRDQMTQALETTQGALSKNFLEEHRKLLVEVLEEREMRVHEAQQLRSRLDVVLAAVQKSGLAGDDSTSAGVTSQLSSMREAIKDLRANMDEELRGNAPSSKSNHSLQASYDTETRSTEDGVAEADGKLLNPATERFVFDELAKLRADIASCLDAANAAVRLGEHLTNELHMEVEGRCSDVKSLRAWVLELFQAPNSMDANEEDLLAYQAKVLTTATGAIMHGHYGISDEIAAAQERLRLGQSISHSPYTAPRDSPSSLHIAGGNMRKRGENADASGSLHGLEHKFGHSMMTLPSVAAWGSQPGLISGSQNLPLGSGTDATGLSTPGLMVSGGGTPLARRQHTMPAGERYLASQRRAAGTGQSQGSNSAVPGLSPRQPRLQSPIRSMGNYHLLQRVDVPPQELRRQQASSPVRDNRDTLAASFGPVALQTSASMLGSGQPSSTLVSPGSALGLDSSRSQARRMVSGVKLSRSASPVQRRATGA